MATLAMLALSAAVLTACGSRGPNLAQMSPADLWERGIEEYNRGRWSDAIEIFDRFATVGGADPRVHQARYYAAEAHFRRGEFITAASRFASLAGDLGRAELAAEARFMACRSYERLAPRPPLDQEYTQAAIEHCQALVDYFPTSVRVEEAQVIVDDMWHRLAAKVFQNGEWYQRRRAFDSAVIYYEDVVELYPRTRYAPRALARIVEIYETLDWDEEADEARSRLRRNYPDSPEAQAMAAGG
jgi:outer membrane protein assembly factor BamD